MISPGLAFCRWVSLSILIRRIFWSFYSFICVFASFFFCVLVIWYGTMFGEGYF